MTKYHFTGHLSPLPPGIELPLQISGDVYLASDVEARIEELERELDLRKAAVAAQFDLMEQVKTLTRSNNRLRVKLDRLSK